MHAVASVCAWVLAGNKLWSASIQQVFYSAVEPAIGVRNTMCPRVWLEGGKVERKGREVRGRNSAN